MTDEEIDDARACEANRRYPWDGTIARTRRMAACAAGLARLGWLPPVHESEFDPLGMVEPRKPELRAVPLGEAQEALKGIMGGPSPRAVSGLGLDPEAVANIHKPSGWAPYLPTPDPAADLLKRADELDTIAAQHKADAERAWCTANGYREAAAIVQRGLPYNCVRDTNPDAKDYSGC